MVVEVEVVVVMVMVMVVMLMVVAKTSRPNRVGTDDDGRPPRLEVADRVADWSGQQANQPAAEAAQCPSIPILKLNKL